MSFKKNTLQHAKISIKSSVYRSVIILLMKKIIKTGTTYASNKCLFFWHFTKCFALIGYSSCDISTHLFRFYLWPIVLSDIFFRGFLLKLQRCNHVKNNYMYQTQSPLNYRLHLIMLKQTPLQEPQFNSCFIFHV